MSKGTHTVTSGRLCISLVALLTAIGAFIADWNETHIYNPRWPPHAKFHNGQTMSMGLCLGIATLYYLWRPRYDKDSLLTACVFCNLYWVTQASAFFYPGSLPVDPEFGTTGPQLRGYPVLFGLIWFGYWLEIRRLDGEKRANN